MYLNGFISKYLTLEVIFITFISTLILSYSGILLIVIRCKLKAISLSCIKLACALLKKEFKKHFYNFDCDLNLSICSFLHYVKVRLFCMFLDF